jgi:hypothetical protein
MGAPGAGRARQRRDAHCGRVVRINRQQRDLHIETQNVPPDSRIELIADTETDWNALQASLLRIRLS